MRKAWNLCYRKCRNNNRNRTAGDFFLRGSSFFPLEKGRTGFFVEIKPMKKNGVHKPVYIKKRKVNYYGEN